jgi:hypothetical protein
MFIKAVGYLRSHNLAHDYSVKIAVCKLASHRLEKASVKPTNGQHFFAVF